MAGDLRSLQCAGGGVGGCGAGLTRKSDGAEESSDEGTGKQRFRVVGCNELLGCTTRSLHKIVSWCING